MNPLFLILILTVGTASSYVRPSVPVINGNPPRNVVDISDIRIPPPVTEVTSGYEKKPYTGWKWGKIPTAPKTIYESGTTKSRHIELPPTAKVITNYDEKPPVIVNDIVEY